MSLYFNNFGDSVAERAGEGDGLLARKVEELC